LIICALKQSVQRGDDEKECTKKVFDTWRGGRSEYQSPVSVTTVEERKFYSERRKPVVYQKEGGGRKEREERDKGTMKRALSV
jgi:hypothetical protein